MRRGRGQGNAVVWVRIDDELPDHPKYVDLSPEAFQLAIKALCWSNRKSTLERYAPGFIPRRKALELAFGNESAIREMMTVPPSCKSSIWIEVEGGYQIHDREVYQPSDLANSRVQDARRNGGKSRAENAVRGPDGRFVPTDDPATAPADHPAPVQLVQQTAGVQLVQQSPAKPAPESRVPYPVSPETRECPNPPRAHARLSHSRDPGFGAGYTPDFQEFWRHYPRQSGIGYAWAEWRDKRPPLAEVLAALEWQKRSEKWTEDEGAFIPDPAKYLRGRCWEDS